MNVTGKILSFQSGSTVPRATIALFAGNVTLVTTAADDNGNFSISTSGYPEGMRVSSVGYDTRTFSLAEMNELNSYYLNPSAGELPDVTVTTKKAAYGGFVLLVFIALLLMKKKR